MLAKSLGALALVIAAAAPAFAADALEDLPDMPAPAFRGTFYGSIHGGSAWYPTATATFVGVGGLGEFATDTGHRLGGAVGYMIDPMFAVEAEITRSSADLDTVTIPAFAVTMPVEGSASALGFFANGYLAHEFGPVRPYVGGGVGWVHTSLNNVDLGNGTDDSDTVLGLQAMIGVDYALTGNLSVGARYRYQHIGETNFNDNDGDPVTLEATNVQSVEGVLTVKFGN